MDALARGRIAGIRHAMEARDARCAAGDHQPYAVVMGSSFFWWCRNPWCWWHRPDIDQIWMKS